MKNKSKLRIYRRKLKRYNVKQLERELDILKLEESFYNGIPQYISIILTASGISALWEQYTAHIPVLIGILLLVTWGVKLILNHFKDNFGPFLLINIKRKFINKELESRKPLSNNSMAFFYLYCRI